MRGGVTKYILFSFLILLSILIKTEISFATNTIWNFTDNLEYYLSNTNEVEISGSLGKLKLILEHKGSINNGAGGAQLDRVEGIVVDGNYAYIVSGTDDALEIIDISNPSNPTHATSLIDGDQGIYLNDPRGIVKSGNYLFIATYRDDSVEVVDVSNPLNPIFVGEIYDSGKTYLNGATSLYISGNYLYTTSYLDDALEIINISNPKSPTHAGSIRNTTRLNGADSVVVSGNYAYVSSYLNDSIQIINISNPNNPFFVGELKNGTNGALLDGPRGLDIKGNYLYVTSSNSDTLEIIDISNPNSPTHISSLLNGGNVLLNEPIKIFIEGDYAYIGSHSSDGVEIVNISDPSNPTHVTSISDSGILELDGAGSIQKMGNYIYVGGKIDDGLEILKISYSNNNPYIIPNKSLVYLGSIDKITTTFGTGNEGNVTYQISKDNGNNWYYLNGGNREIATLGTSQSSNENELNSEIQTFNGIAGGTGEFKWKAFLNGNGNQKVEIDEVKIDFTSAGTNEIIDFEKPGGYTVTKGTFSRVNSMQYEGFYSIQSGNHTNNSTSCFEISKNVYTKSDLKFYKKVSSEPNYDFLRFSIDGVMQDEWHGEDDWSEETYVIDNGNHTFEWCYVKDYSNSNGSDTAWVDYIEIVENDNSEVAVLDFEVPGGYSVTTTNQWLRVTNEKYEGSYSLESQNNSHNSSACFERIQTVGPNENGIAFYRKVSSESGFDPLIFSINGFEKDRWGGEVAWEQKTYKLSPGTYTLEWCYKKDKDTSGGQDKAWVDLVTVTSNPPELTEIIPVPTPTNDNTPDYTFNSTMSGTILYSGSCSSNQTNAIIGNNTITFNTLSDGIYTDCSIQIIGNNQNSTILDITNFTIDTTGIDITINTPLDGNSIPSNDFDININYSDEETGVDTSSIILKLFKWNGITYGEDISGNYVNFTGAIITNSGAIYPTSKLPTGKYKLEFTINDNIGNDGTAISVFDVDSSDTTPPSITINSPLNNKLYPNSNFNINVSYNDGGTGINTGSISLSLKKWNGTSYGTDIAPLYINYQASIITSTGAIYSTTKLGYGKYKIDYNIGDNNGNTGTGSSEFYVDEPEVIVSTGTIDFGTLNIGTNNFSPEIIITVKTVGAGFDLVLNKTSALEYSSIEIIDWNGTNGIGYDKNPYSNTINIINSNEIIASNSGSINLSGNKNIYTYGVKFGANVNKNQAAGNYLGNIDFGLKLDY